MVIFMAGSAHAFLTNPLDAKIGVSAENTVTTITKKQWNDTYAETDTTYSFIDDRGRTFAKGLDQETYNIKIGEFANGYTQRSLSTYNPSGSQTSNNDVWCKLNSKKVITKINSDCVITSKFDPRAPAMYQRARYYEDYSYDSITGKPVKGSCLMYLYVKNIYNADCLSIAYIVNASNVVVNTEVYKMKLVNGIWKYTLMVRYAGSAAPGAIYKRLTNLPNPVNVSFL